MSRETFAKLFNYF